MSNKTITVWDQSTNEIIDLEIDEAMVSPFAKTVSYSDVIKTTEDEINDKD